MFRKLSLAVALSLLASAASAAPWVGLKNSSPTDGSYYYVQCQQIVAMTSTKGLGTSTVYVQTPTGTFQVIGSTDLEGQILSACNAGVTAVSPPIS